MLNKKIKVGDEIYIEQAWEDDTGAYHDEYANVLAIAEDGRMKLKFNRDEVTAFLSDAEFYVQDYENN